MNTKSKELKSERLMLRLTMTQLAKLDIYCAANEITAPQLIRKLLNSLFN